MKSFVILGAGRFGQSVAKTLYSLGSEVLVIDNDEIKISEIADCVTKAIIGDCSDEIVLKSLGVRNFDVAIIAVGGNLETSIMATMLLKEMGVKYILAKSSNDTHSKILKKVGADKVVLPEKDMGIKIAKNLVSENMLDYIELSHDYSIAEIALPLKWIGKNIREINVRATYNINIMAIKTKTEIQVNPDAERVFLDGDVLVVVGKNEDIESIE